MYRSILARARAESKPQNASVDTPVMVNDAVREKLGYQPRSCGYDATAFSEDS